MSLVNSIDFEAGPNGGSATQANIPAANVVGSGLTYSNAGVTSGTYCLLCTTSASLTNFRVDNTAASLMWHSFYWTTPSALPGTNLTIAQWNGTIAAVMTKIGDLRFLTDGTVSLRDSSTAVYTTPAAVGLNTRIRVSIRVQPGSATGHQLRLYIGSNADGTTPDYDSGNRAATAAGGSVSEQISIGHLTSSTSVSRFDRYRSDNATEPAGLPVSGPPTVNAGPDLTKETGSAAFTITGTGSGNAGATIVSRAWTVFAGIAVTLSGQATDTLTVTPPATAGTTTLRLTYTDSNGLTASDDMIVTWVTPGQVFRPVADISLGGWTAVPVVSPIAGNIDEVVLDLTDYVISPASPTAAKYRMRLESKPAPGSTSGVYVFLIMDVVSGTASHSVVVRLYESDGTTLRKTFTAITDLTTTPTERQLTLTTGEVATITSWASGLILEVEATAA